MTGGTFSFNALFFRLCLLYIEIQLLLPISSSIDVGFSVDIFHRDSPESPLHDPSSTPFTRLHAAINRSAFRVNYLRRARFDFKAPPPGPLQDGLSTSLRNYNSEFLMKLYIGANDKEVFVGIDTASSFLWTLCHPCKDCYEHISTIFDPSSSKSYEKLVCNIQPCTLHPYTTCDVENKCEYNATYLDDSFIKGVLSTETIGFKFADGKRKYHLHDIIFGCTHETKGNFGQGGIGLVGLNQAPLSLMSQLGPTFGMRFSYCLPRKVNHRSKLYFGEAAIVSGDKVMTTPLFTNIDDDYYLKLDAIKVGKGKPIIVSPPQNKLHGNIMIDTGTLLTYLESMHHIVEKVKQYIPLNLKFEYHYDLCFDTSNATESYRLPKITYKFDGDVEFVVDGNNAFSQINNTTMCLLMASTKESDGDQIFGNHAQVGYRIGYDIDNLILNFHKDKDCSAKYFHSGRS